MYCVKACVKYRFHCWQYKLEWGLKIGRYGGFIMVLIGKRQVPTESYQTLNLRGDLILKRENLRLKGRFFLEVS